jgi:hypothetical protein
MIFFCVLLAKPNPNEFVSGILGELAQYLTVAVGPGIIVCGIITCMAMAIIFAILSMAILFEKTEGENRCLQAGLL